MGILRSDSAPERTVHLDRVSVEVGRDSGCGLLLPFSDISRKHAVFRWTGNGWNLFDLNSKNGTFLWTAEGRCVRIDRPIDLRVGDRLSFGPLPEVWTLVSDLRPPARAVAEGGGEQVEEPIGQGLRWPGLQVIPRGGDWVRTDLGSAVGDGEALRIDGRRWLLDLPVPQTRTGGGPEAEERVLALALRCPAPVTLHLERRPDGQVSGWTDHGSAVGTLPTRACMRLLWLLASSAEQWIDQNLLVRELGLQDRQGIDNYVHQLRRLLHEQGGLPLDAADRLIERDRGRVRVITRP